MSYVNAEGSGVTHTSMRKDSDPVKDRVMMIAQRLVALEKEVAELKKKVK